LSSLKHQKISLKVLMLTLLLTTKLGLLQKNRTLSNIATFMNHMYSSRKAFPPRIFDLLTFTSYSSLHSLTHALSYSHSLAHTHLLTLTHSHSLTHTHSHSLTHTHVLTLKLTYFPLPHLISHIC